MSNSCCVCFRVAQIMEYKRLGSDVSLSQLLELVEKRLENIAATLRYSMGFQSVGYGWLIVTHCPLAVLPIPRHPNRFEREHHYCQNR